MPTDLRHHPTLSPPWPTKSRRALEPRRTAVSPQDRERKGWTAFPPAALALRPAHAGPHDCVPRLTAAGLRQQLSLPTVLTPSRQRADVRRGRAQPRRTQEGGAVPAALEAAAELPAMPADDEAMPALRTRARTHTPIRALGVRWAVRRQTGGRRRLTSCEDAPRCAARAASGTGERACGNLQRALKRRHANRWPCRAAPCPPATQWRMPAKVRMPNGECFLQVECVLRFQPPPRSPRGPRSIKVSLLSCTQGG